MSVPALAAVRQLLLRPAAFFEERPPATTLPIAAGLVVVLAIALGVSVFLLGSMLAGTVEGTVTMDNPDRPPDWVCEQHGDDPDSQFGEDCDEPETIERDAGALVYEAVTDYLGYVVVAPFVIWLVGGAVLFGAARLANGSPSISGTYALAGWAALPELFRTAVGLAALWVALSGVTITDLERAADVLEVALAPVDPIVTLATLVTVLWQWYLLTGGLVEEADLSWSAAGFAVGAPLFVWLLIGLT